MKWLLLAISFNLAAAQIPEDVQHEADQRVKHNYNQGIVLGVYENQSRAYHISGWANKENKIKLNKQSVFEIGSITKTMTALLLAEAVVKNKVSLDDHIDNLLPTELKFTSPKAITLKQLSTHSSGLPRLPSNQKNIMGKDPYADYQREDLLAAISDQTVSPNQQHYAYSNYGVGLLGEALAILNQDSYQNLLKKRVFEPLNMNNSYADASLVPEDRRVTGYAGKYAVPNWHFKALAGAGSVNSSIEDLLTFGIAILKADHPELKQAIALSKQIHYQDRGVTLGLNWHINKGVLWHNGGTAGFRSILMIDPEQEKVVAAITNQAEHAVEDMAGHLLKPENEMKSYDFPVEISEDELKAYTGTFHNKVNDKTIKTSIKDGFLMLHFPKQPAYRLTYLGQNKFIMKLTKTRIRFETKSSGQFKQLYFKAWGDEQLYQRVE
ncbi:serine hydrolase domain-containing protein [Marinicella rhabdoformis]|uniref:serine hydrolase domain-containing protein n=1 Tax=Marinicella rhabdoformis TaxID=2580566 RepID=UPI0012AED247|nr:serine hydrolase domain-containing protein [Marinicella rhabdoformis]